MNCVALGEEILIAKDGQTMAKLVPIPEAPAISHPPRVLGIDAGKQFWISADFDDSLPEAVLRKFEK